MKSLVLEKIFCWQDPANNSKIRSLEVPVIIGTYKTKDKEELKFIKNLTDMFSAFLKTGLLTKGNDLSFEKMYLVDYDNILSKDMSLHLIKSPVLPKVKNMFWTNFNSSLSSVSQVPKMVETSIILSAILSGLY